MRLRMEDDRVAQNKTRSNRRVERESRQWLGIDTLATAIAVAHLPRQALGILSGTMGIGELNASSVQAAEM